MPLQPILKAAGLYSADNPHSAVPEGALVLAQNAVLRYRNVPEPRRGQGYMQRDGEDVGLLDTSERTNEGVWFQDYLICHHGGATLGTNFGSAVDGGGDPILASLTGGFTPPDAAMLRMRFMEFAGNLYFNTNAGNYLIEANDGTTPTKAGLPPAFDDEFSWKSYIYLRVTGDDGWMAADTAAAYRYTWAIKDSHGNLKEGAPSGRFIVKNRVDVAVTLATRTSNVVTVVIGATHNYIIGDVVTLLTPNATFTAGPHTLTAVTANSFTYAETAANAASAIAFEYGADSNVLLNPKIPPGITTSHFVRVWRSAETEDADLEPSDEVFLVKEEFPTAAEIATGYMAITDITPTSQLDVPAYFNANSGDGTIETTAKYRPPIGKHLLEWDGRAWCVNTTDKHRFHLRVLGVGSPNGIQNNDTVTINGQVLTYKAAGENFAAYEFASTAWPLGTFETIELTARSIVECINYNSVAMGLVAYYESDDRAPGKILIEERDIGGSAFNVWASRPASWGPAIGAFPYATGTVALATVLAGDTAQICGVTFTGVAGAATPGAATFSVDTDNTAAAASLASQLNAHLTTSGLVNATSNLGAVTLVADAIGAGGNILGLVSGAGTITVSAATLLGGYTPEHSENDRREGGGSFSEDGEPEAFPLLNWLNIAPKGVEILGAVGFRDRMYCFGKNRKVYTVTGPAPYRSTETDGSALLIAPDSLKVHANQVMALTDQGVGILTDAGFRIVSGGPEDVILDCLALTPSVVSRRAFAVSYESDRQYQLWIPTSNDDTCAKQGWIYNSMANTWTGPWIGDRTWGGISPVDGKLYMGEGSAARIRQERKSFNRTDYADEAFGVEIDSSTTSTVTLASATGVTAGDVLNQAGTDVLITNVNGNVLTVTPEGVEFDADVADIYKGYTVAVKWAPLALGNPRQMKTWRDVTFHFREYLAANMFAAFDTEENLTESTAGIEEAVSYLPQGYTPALGLRNRRVEVTDNHKSAAMLRVGITVREAYAMWGLHGFTVAYEPAGEGGSG